MANVTIADLAESTTPASTDIIEVEVSSVSKKVTLANAIKNGLAVGSDADGDMYYRASDVLARLAKGTAGQFLKMNSGASAPEWGSILPSGVKMIFYQDTAPIGWTIENTLDDKLLFITKGSAAGGQLGGGAHSTGTWTQPNHTHTGPSHTHTTGDVTLTAAQSGLPSHSHAIPNGANGTGLWLGISYSNRSDMTKDNTSYNAAADASSAHNHGTTAAGGTGDTGASATANTWRPASYCAIIATKD